MKFIFILSLLLLTTYAFSAGSGDTSGVNAIYEFTYGERPKPPVTKVQISPSQEIIDIFEDNDVDPIYLSINENPDITPDQIRRDINRVISEDIDEIVSKIKGELKDGLVEGEIEYTYMVIGSRLFSMSLSFR